MTIATKLAAGLVAASAFEELTEPAVVTVAEPAPVAEPAAEAPARLPSTTTFSLRVPVTDDDGKRYDHLVLAAPELHHEKALQAPSATRSGDGTVDMISVLSGVPVAAIRRLAVRDGLAIAIWLAEQRRAAAVSDDPAADTESDGAKRQTFTLLTPVVLDTGEVVSEITLGEPTLETGMLADKVEGQAAKTAVMLAHCSGRSPAVINRLKLRDVARLEAWLDPFWAAGAASLIAPASQPSANDSPQTAA